VALSSPHHRRQLAGRRDASLTGGGREPLTPEATTGSPADPGGRTATRPSASRGGGGMADERPWERWMNLEGESGRGDDSIGVASGEGWTVGELRWPWPGLAQRPTRAVAWTWRKAVGSVHSSRLESSPAPSPSWAGSIRLPNRAFLPKPAVPLLVAYMELGTARLAASPSAPVMLRQERQATPTGTSILGQGRS
jgi:hypothetical protein